MLCYEEISNLGFFQGEGSSLPENVLVLSAFTTSMKIQLLQANILAKRRFRLG
jgi:hypothetical protein